MAQKDTHHNGNGSNVPQDATERPLDSTIRIVQMDEDGLRDWLSNLKSSVGFITDLAPQLGVSPQYLGDVLAGRKSFGPKMIEGMKEFGLVRVYQLFDVEIVMDDGNGE